MLRSGVAPQRCTLSYTAAKICKVLETTKTFREKVAKNVKVSHGVGHFKGEISRFPPNLLKYYNDDRLMKHQIVPCLQIATIVVSSVGMYDIGLDEPIFCPVFSFLQKLKSRSVEVPGSA